MISGEKNIYLTGFMGVGKSTVGRQLAEKIGYLFVDTDEKIKEETRMSIPEIFNQKGEAFFRRIERDIVLGVTHSSKTVVSLGGGALNDLTSRDQVLNSGLLIYLEASAESLIQRLQHQKDRPLLAGLTVKQKEEKIRTLLGDREPIYCLAPMKIKTDHKSVSEIVQEIAEGLTKKMGKKS